MSCSLVTTQFPEMTVHCQGGLQLYSSTALALQLQLYSSSSTALHLQLELYSSTALALQLSISSFTALALSLQLYSSRALELYGSTARQLYSSTDLQLYSSTTLQLQLYSFTFLALQFQLQLCNSRSSSTALQLYRSTALQLYSSTDQIKLLKDLTKPLCSSFTAIRLNYLKMLTQPASGTMLKGGIQPKLSPPQILLQICYQDKSV